MPHRSNLHIRRLEDLEVLPALTGVLFVLTFVIKAFTDGPYVRGEISASVAYMKYATAAFACCFAFVLLVKRKRHIFVQESRKLASIVALFTVMSVLMQIAAGYIGSSTYIELVKLAMPMIMAFCILNALDSNQIYICMIAVLVFSFAGYLVDLAANGVSLSAVASADYSTSESETESSGFAEISLMLSLYFCYVRRGKLAMMWSVAFCILTFKRLSMLIAPLALVISLFVPKLMNRQLPRQLVICFKIITIIGAGLWCWILLPQQEPLFIRVFGTTPFDFTLGRSSSLRYLLTSDFHSYGFGSANAVIDSLFGVPFEMDLAKIAIELTPLTMVAFVWLFWDLSADIFWSTLIIGYYMLNMITSDSLTSNFSFTLAYIVIGIVNCQSYGRPTSRTISTVNLECSQGVRYGI